MVEEAEEGVIYLMVVEEVVVVEVVVEEVDESCKISVSGYLNVVISYFLLEIKSCPYHLTHAHEFEK